MVFERWSDKEYGGVNRHDTNVTSDINATAHFKIRECDYGCDPLGAVDGNTLVLDWDEPESRSFSLEATGDSGFPRGVEGKPTLRVGPIQPGTGTIEITEERGEENEDNSQFSVSVPPETGGSAGDGPAMQAADTCTPLDLPTNWLEHAENGGRLQEVHSSGDKAVTLGAEGNAVNILRYEDQAWAQVDSRRLDTRSTEIRIDGFHRDAFARSPESGITVLRLDEDEETESKLVVSRDGLIDHAVTADGRRLLTLTAEGTLSHYRIEDDRREATLIDSDATSLDWIALRPGSQWVYGGDRSEATLSVLQIDREADDIHLVTAMDGVPVSERSEFTPDGQFLLAYGEEGRRLFPLNDSGLPESDKAFPICDFRDTEQRENTDRGEAQ